MRGDRMRPWQHSHNLKETTRDRLESVARELEVERAHPKGADPQRVDKALSLIREALKVLSS